MSDKAKTPDPRPVAAPAPRPEPLTSEAPATCCVRHEGMAAHERDTDCHGPAPAAPAPETPWPCRCGHPLIEHERGGEAHCCAENNGCGCPFYIAAPAPPPPAASEPAPEADPLRDADRALSALVFAHIIASSQDERVRKERACRDTIDAARAERAALRERARVAEAALREAREDALSDAAAIAEGTDVVDATGYYAQLGDARKSLQNAASRILDFAALAIAAPFVCPRCRAEFGEHATTYKGAIELFEHLEFAKKCREAWRAAGAKGGDDAS